MNIRYEIQLEKDVKAIIRASKTGEVSIKSLGAALVKKGYHKVVKVDLAAKVARIDSVIIVGNLVALR